MLDSMRANVEWTSYGLLGLNKSARSRSKCENRFILPAVVCYIAGYLRRFIEMKRIVLARIPYKQTNSMYIECENVWAMKKKKIRQIQIYAPSLASLNGAISRKQTNERDLTCYILGAPHWNGLPDISTSCGKVLAR